MRAPMRRHRPLALPEAAHLAHAAPDVDREDLRILVEAGRPGPAPATLGEPAGPLAAQHRDDEEVRELPHQVVDVGKALAGAEPELGGLSVVFKAAGVVRHRSRGPSGPRHGRQGDRGVRGAQRTRSIYCCGPSAPRTVFCGRCEARTGTSTSKPGASGEVRSASSQASPGRRLRVPRAAPGPGHAFPVAAPVPSHVTTPHERAPRVDGERYRTGFRTCQGLFSGSFAVVISEAEQTATRDPSAVRAPSEWRVGFPRRLPNFIQLDVFPAMFSIRSEESSLWLPINMFAQGRTRAGVEPRSRRRGRRCGKVPVYRIRSLT
jgi:hypothetical protein